MPKPSFCSLIMTLLMCVQCNNDKTPPNKLGSPIAVEHQLPKSTLAGEEESETAPIVREAAGVSCFAYREVSGMNLFVREARLTLRGKVAKLEYCGFSRPDNMNFRCNLEGGASGGQSFAVEGKTYSYGSEMGVGAQLTLKNGGRSLLVKLHGGLGDEEIELAQTDCGEMELIKPM